MIKLGYDIHQSIAKPNFVQNKVELSVDFECQYLLNKNCYNHDFLSMESYDKGLLEMK